MGQVDETPAEEPKLCADCGKPEDSFACRIRHVSVLHCNSEAKQHDEDKRKERQVKKFGV